MELSDMDDTRSAAKPTTFLCTICPKSFLHASSLQDHVLNKHMDDKDKTFQCMECLKTKQLVKFFATQQILNKHVRQAHGPASGFKCQVCLKTFKNSSHLAHHKRTHSQTDMNRYKCHLCAKAFPFNSQLHSHLFHIHKHKFEHVNYFKCEFCSREFLSRSALKTHVVQKHVLDKAFQCPVCSKKFIDQETLKKHIKNHERERLRYICDMCSKGFFNKRFILSHLQIYHNHLFYCDLCLASFKNKSEFDAHNILSDSKLKLQCSLCQQSFISDCNLKIHTDSHVKEIKTGQMESNVDKPTELPLE